MWVAESNLSSVVKTWNPYEDWLLGWESLRIFFQFSFLGSFVLFIRETSHQTHIYIYKPS